jgi:hypothetical protein
MFRYVVSMKYQAMSPIALYSMSSTSFAYVECDIPEGQTLVEWRRELEAARAAARPARRRVRLLARIGIARWSR